MSVLPKTNAVSSRPIGPSVNTYDPTLPSTNKPMSPNIGDNETGNKIGLSSTIRLID